MAAILLPVTIIRAYTSRIRKKSEFPQRFPEITVFIDKTGGMIITMRKTVTGTQQPANGGETLASIVYNKLLEDILKGDLEPGRKLRLQALKEQYEVGNSRLRKALSRLSAIRDAAIDRDADLAVELLTAHFNVTADIVMSSGALT